MLGRGDLIGLFKSRNVLTAANIDLFKVNNKNIKRGMKYAKSLWRRSGVFIVNFEHYLHLFKVFLLLTLNRQMLAEKAFFEHRCMSVSV